MMLAVLFAVYEFVGVFGGGVRAGSACAGGHRSSESARSKERSAVAGRRRECHIPDAEGLVRAYGLNIKSKLQYPEFNSDHPVFFH